jgi:hypothetical protein
LDAGILGKTAGDYYGPKEVTLKILRGPKISSDVGNKYGMPSRTLGVKILREVNKASK